jgi:arginyl-tRNA synthetase
MTLSIREELNATLRSALGEIAGDKAGDIAWDKCEFGAPRQAGLGDLATSAPLVVTKLLGRNPIDIAGELATRLAAHPAIASAEAARPGFVNVRLSAAALGGVLAAISAAGANYGQCNVGAGSTVLLEFVSANPTGPMHLGHCRHAATGDALARVLTAAGYRVTKEFYINDAGVQIGALGESFRARCMEVLGEPFEAEKVQYPGEYLAEFARDFVAQKGEAAIRAMSLADFAWEARNRNLAMIQADLAAAGVYFDHYQSERALHDAKAVEKTLAALEANGATYEKDGALWLRTMDHGDNEDRVLRKADGSVTYLVPDLAYHADKFRRGYDRYINIFGADHAGYPARLRAGIAHLGYDPARLHVLLLRLVFLTRAGQRVKFSKRAGNFVAMSDVVAEAGPDATRWFMLCRSIDSEFEFDIELATQNSSKNPVFKVQYAHARICSLQAKAAELGLAPEADATAAMEKLATPLEREMVQFLARLPEVVERSARELAVHHLPAYLLAVADYWNSYYSQAKTDAGYRILAPENAAMAPARLRLAAAIRTVLAAGLALMGISAPCEMARQDDEAEPES